MVGRRRQATPLKTRFPAPGSPAPVTEIFMNAQRTSSALRHSPEHSGSSYDAYDSAFQPEVVLPSQFFRRRRAVGHDESLERLMLALLADAIRCYQRNLGARSRPRQLEFLEAESWLFKYPADGPFSVESVCAVLGADVSLLRGQLREWRQARLVGGTTIRSLPGNPRRRSGKIKQARSRVPKPLNALFG